MKTEVLYCVSSLVSKQMVEQSQQIEPKQHANNSESNIAAVSSTKYCETCLQLLKTCEAGHPPVGNQ